jgi:hypothetical protein
MLRINIGGAFNTGSMVEVASGKEYYRWSTLTGCDIQPLTQHKENIMKTIYLPGTVLLASMFLVACGSDESSAPAPAAVSPAPAAVETTMDDQSETADVIEAVTEEVQAAVGDAVEDVKAAAGEAADDIMASQSKEDLEAAMESAEDKLKDVEEDAKKGLEGMMSN